MNKLATNSPKYLRRLAMILATHTHVYHAHWGRLLLGSYSLVDGRLLVKLPDWTEARELDHRNLRDGNGNPILASRIP